MFFMSKKRFEEELNRRLEHERDMRYIDERFTNLMHDRYREGERFDRRIAALEEVVFKKASPSEYRIPVSKEGV